MKGEWKEQKLKQPCALDMILSAQEVKFNEV